MSLMRLLRDVLKKDRAHRPLEYVSDASDEPLTETAPAAAPAAPQALPTADAIREGQIAFSPQIDLEAYVRGLEVSQQAIERWISAGVLLPEETKVAAKMIRIMCQKKIPPPPDRG